MSYVPSPPTLSYVSSVDVTSAANQGLTKYQILFDASLVTLGNLIMFEYKFQDVSALTPDLDNTSFGFISVEDAVQSGIENQYIIAVPALANTYDGTVDNTIQVRVYFGITSSSNNVVVTPWSNELNVYNPPVQPIIYVDASDNQGAYYDPSGSDTLYVLLNPDPSGGNPYNYAVMKFVVCYFYQDTSNETVWSVSDPLSTSTISFGTQNFRLITVPNIGTVSTTSPNDKVYVSTHAVYDWEDSSNNYYAVSYMSNEVVAISATSDSTPDITSVDYNVYDTSSPPDPTVPGPQSMTVNWTAPGNSVLPFYNINYYNLYTSVNGNPFQEYQSNIPPNTPLVNFYTVDVSNLDCGDTIRFRVDAYVVNGAVEQSNIFPDPADPAISIFKYSDAVTNLQISDITYDPSSNIGMTVTFDGVSDTLSPNAGCGAGQQYVVLINSIQQTPVSINGVPSGLPISYVPDISYSIVYENLGIASSGTVEVYLQTTDTNSPFGLRNGLTSSTPYIATDFELDPVDYQVYASGNSAQNMVLTWTDPTTSLSGWSVTGYDVEFSIDSGFTWNPAPSGTGILTTTYSFDASSYANSILELQFRVIATVENNTVSPAVSYTIVSNTESQYTFQYATNPVNALVNWVVTDPSNTIMDINVTFQNPTFEGVNNGLQFFRVTVYDASTAVITSLDVSYNTPPIFNSGEYIVTFNDLTYSPNGTIVIAPYVTDTNTVNNITNSLYTDTLFYVTDRLPVYLNIVSTGSSSPGAEDAVITGNIISNNLLKPVATVSYPNSAGIADIVLNFGPDDVVVPGVTSTFIILDPTTTPPGNGEYYYTFTINPYQFFTPSGYIPPRCILSASNNAGIGYGIVNPINP